LRPTLARIDLGALRHNLHIAKRHATKSKVFAVVKANAYGHGLLRAARAFDEADGFAVIEPEAAVRLREAGYGKPILLLEGFFEPSELAVLAQYQLSTTVHTFEQLDMLDALPRGSAIDVMLKVNTGMNRLGFQPPDFARALERLRRHAAVRSITAMTHFANADDQRGIASQLAVFDSVIGGELPRSLANSAATLRYPVSHADWVRPGIMLYGCSPFAESIGADLDLRPAMTLESAIIAVREIAAGESVGYGSIFTADSPTRVGVVACGYADGYPRHAPTGTPVLVGGRLTRTLGRVSMDMLCVDLTGSPHVRVGTPVVLWGDGNPVERVAESAGTVGYELLCALAPRVRIVEQP
jgi:alanine racemase